MDVSPKKEYCIIKCRVSDDIQLKGGGLERQESAGKFFAGKKDWIIDRVIRTPHSATTTERDDIEADIAYIQKRKREGISIRYYVVQTLDRFTRVGSTEYLHLKAKLEAVGVLLIDASGIIQPKQNTLEHLGNYEYPWSTYSPSEGGELMAAQDSKDEVRKILTRLVGAEIKLVQDGYAVRGATDGLENAIVLVGAKERVVRKAGSRAPYFQKMFELLAEGMDYPEVCERLNAMGFKTQARHKWDKSDPENPKVVGTRGDKPLTSKQLQRYVLRTEYAGVSCEKWNKHRPVKMQEFDGIVSVDVFNRANRGAVYIEPMSWLAAAPGEEVEIRYNYSPWGRVKRLRDNPRYPWKCILCPHCKSEMTASSATGKGGKEYYAYHCGGMLRNRKRNHRYFRVPQETFEKSVRAYLDSLRFKAGFMAGLELHLIDKYRTREKEILVESSAIGRNVSDLKAELAKKLDAFTFAESPVMRRMLEEQVALLDQQIQQAESERGKVEITEKSIRAFRKYAEKLMEHPGELLTNADNMHARRTLLSLFFEEIPTYQEILNGTPKLTPIFRLSEEFKRDKTQLVSPMYLEWNTLENMVLSWERVFGMIPGLSLNEEYA